VQPSLENGRHGGSHRRRYLGVAIALLAAAVSIGVAIVIIANGFVTAIPALIGAILIDVSVIRFWARISDSASTAQGESPRGTRR
jgi:CHASE2 domain-containing sensor protein